MVVDHAVGRVCQGVGSVQAAKAAVTRSSRPADARRPRRWRVARARYPARLICAAEAAEQVGLLFGPVALRAVGPREGLERLFQQLMAAL